LNISFTVKSKRYLCNHNHNWNFTPLKCVGCTLCMWKKNKTPKKFLNIYETWFHSSDLKFRPKFICWRLTIKGCITNRTIRILAVYTTSRLQKHVYTVTDLYVFAYKQVMFSNLLTLIVTRHVTEALRYVTRRPRFDPCQAEAIIIFLAYVFLGMLEADAAPLSISLIKKLCRGLADTVFPDRGDICSMKSMGPRTQQKNHGEHRTKNGNRRKKGIYHIYNLLYHQLTFGYLISWWVSCFIIPPTYGGHWFVRGTAHGVPAARHRMQSSLFYLLISL